MCNVVEVKDLTHYYGSKMVFENLNFNIKEGSIFGLLGKNGTGKTTTINILNGFLKPTSGRCLVFGEDSYKLSPQTKSRVGFLIEGHIQYNFMDIIQLEKFYSSFYPKWNSEPFYELMMKLSVDDDQPISKMSCGQRSQVALGLILAQDPDILILDDYSMGLDAGYRRLFLEYLNEYARCGRKTIFITSHIIQDLEDLLDDCVIIDSTSVLISMPVKEFQSTFNKYVFETDDSFLFFDRNSIVKNYEIIKRTAEVYSFSPIDEIENLLINQNISYNNLHSVPMTFEDAFIGITGRY